MSSAVFSRHRSERDDAPMLRLACNPTGTLLARGLPTVSRSAIVAVADDARRGGDTHDHSSTLGVHIGGCSVAANTARQDAPTPHPKGTVMQFISESASDGIVERLFTIGDVPGVIWSPADRSNRN